MNHLYYGDNLTVLRDHIADASVGLIYLAPPFNSNATYNVLFRSPTGEQSSAQIEAVGNWHWRDEDAGRDYLPPGIVKKLPGSSLDPQVLHVMRCTSS